MVNNRLNAVAMAMLLVVAGPVFAEACTYQEAIMALEQGNAVRGMALMRMASQDGDLRASEFLASQDYPTAVKENLSAGNVLSQSALPTLKMK